MEEYNGSGRVPWKSAMEMKHSSGQSAVHKLRKTGPAVVGTHITYGYFHIPVHCKQSLF